MEKTQRQMIVETHIAITELTTVLLGVPSTEDTGLVGEVKSIKTDVKELNSRQRKTNVNLWRLVGILTGLGVLGGGSYGISQLLGG